MDDRTIPSPAPAEPDALLITPAISVPTDYPTRVAAALARLRALEPAVLAVAEEIGTTLLPAAHRAWEAPDSSPAVGSAFDALTGWRGLSHQLHALAMALLCAAGEPDEAPEATRPAWLALTAPAASSPPG